MSEVAIRMNALSLFSGVAGLDRSIENLASPALYVEIDPFCRKVLQHRMATGEIPEAPIHEDVKTLTSDLCRSYTGDRAISIITAGFPWYICVK